MTLLEVLLAGAASWAILGTVGGFSWAFVVTRLKRRRAEHVVRLDWLPPVPPPTTPPLSQTVPSADWFRDIPADCLSDDAIRPLFDELIEMEGLK